MNKTLICTFLYINFLHANEPVITHTFFTEYQAALKTSEALRKQASERTSPYGKLLLNKLSLAKLFKFKKPSGLQRYLSSFLVQFSIPVTPSIMPSLYKRMEHLVNSAKLPTMPLIFIIPGATFNAFATSLGQTSPIVGIGEELLERADDDALMAILAHELGHVKHNHVPKKIALVAGIITGAIYGLPYVFDALRDFLPQERLSQEIIKQYIAQIVTFPAIFITNTVISRYFERQADHFALEMLENPETFVRAMQIIEIEQNRAQTELEFAETTITQDQKEISAEEYRRLKLEAAQITQQFWYFKLYEHYLSSHPTTESRIEAAEKYIAEKKSQVQAA